MPTLTIRHIDAELKQKLRMRAPGMGDRSLKGRAMILDLYGQNVYIKCLSGMKTNG
jgi:hypothetical protein